MWPRNAFSAGLLVFLSACGVESTLESCLRTEEPTILLRQLNMSAPRRAEYDRCLAQGLGGDEATEFCGGLYFNANVPVRQCMKARGFIFTDEDSGWGSCGWSKYKVAGCYKSLWQLKAEVLFGLR